MKKKIIYIKQTLLNSEFIKVSSKNSIQVALRFIIGMINLKIYSLWLGASGMALLGQFNSFILAASNFAGAGINQGVTKLTALYSDSSNRTNIVVSNSLILILLLSALISVITFLFSTSISEAILNTKSYAKWFKACGIIFLSLSLSNIFLSILKGLKKHMAYIKLNIYMVLSSFSLGLLFIYLEGLKGAIIAIYISSVLNVLIGFVFTKNEMIKAFKKFNFSKLVFKRLLGFGLMLMIASSVSPLVSIIIRNVIIEEYSLHMAGWWEGVSKISKTLFGLSISTIGLYYIPKISNQYSTFELNKLVWNTVKLAMPFVVLLQLLIYTSRHLIIQILFTKEFHGMENLFLFQSIGDVLRIFSWFFAILLIIKEKINLFITIEIIMATINISLNYIIIPIVGISNCTLPYMINTIIYFILIQLIYKKHILRI